VHLRGAFLCLRGVGASAAAALSLVPAGRTNQWRGVDSLGILHNWDALCAKAACSNYTPQRVRLCGLPAVAYVANGAVTRVTRIRRILDHNLVPQLWVSSISLCKRHGARFQVLPAS